MPISTSQQKRRLTASVPTAYTLHTSTKIVQPRRYPERCLIYDCLRFKKMSSWMDCPRTHLSAKRFRPRHKTPKSPLRTMSRPMWMEGTDGSLRAVSLLTLAIPERPLLTSYKAPVFSASSTWGSCTPGVSSKRSLPRTSWAVPSL
jgi:hypothetical protein